MSKWYILCDVCGKKIYNTDAFQRWDGLLVCANDYERKHPLLGYRYKPKDGEGSVSSKQLFTGHEDLSQSVLVCDIYTSMGISGYGTAGCAQAGTFNLNFSPLPSTTGPVGSENPIIIPSTSEDEETMTIYETEYWQAQAALLDPLAYVFETGAAFTISVPTGEQWYLLNAWSTRLGDAAGDFFLRNPTRPMPMSEGFLLKSNGNASATAYYCKPSLVTGTDSRYTTDPKGLYYERIARLRTLILNEIYATTSAGVASTPSTPFPTDFSYGLVVAVSAHDTSWTILAPADNVGGINLMNEVSDLHQWRAAHAFYLPFSRSTFTVMEVRSASVAGTVGSELAGTGALMYYKLPSGW